MTKLKKRERVDRLKSEVRQHKKHHLARNIYLAALLVLAISIFDMAAGNLFYLQAEGMVSRDLNVVSPEYTGTVQSIGVTHGVTVSAGQTVAQLRSQRMLRDIVGASAQLATLQAKLSEMRIRKGTMVTLIPAAQNRYDEAHNEEASLISLVSSGLATNRMRAQASTDTFQALEDLKRLETDSSLIEREADQVDFSVERADRALREIESIYNRGVLTTPVAGTVGLVSATTGSVVSEGTSLIEVFHGPTYVLAYIPVGALYKIEPGDPVSLRFGFHSMEGRVEELLPLAHRLPQEFQRTFETVQREQLVRISIEADAQLPPLFTKVSISWPWSPKSVFSRLITSISG